MSLKQEGVKFSQFVRNLYSASSDDFDLTNSIPLVLQDDTKKIGLNILASADGSFVLSSYFFVSSGSGRIISKNGVSLKKGSYIDYTPSQEGVVLVLLDFRSDGKYYELMRSSSSFTYGLTEDCNVYFDLRSENITPSSYSKNWICIHNVMSSKRIEKINEELYGKASVDGSYELTKNSFVQSSEKILSKSGLSYKKGVCIEFDGEQRGDFCYVLRKDSSGSFYTLISGVKFSYKFSQNEDSIYFNLKKVDGSKYELNDYDENSIVVVSIMSEKSIEKLDSRISEIEDDMSHVDVSSVKPCYAFIKNGRLVACRTDTSGWADYLACEMNDVCCYGGCKWYWPTSSKYTKGVVAMAFMPNSWNKKISGNDGITGKSLHITVTPTKVKLDILGTAWGQYYYHNLLERNIDLDTTATTEHKLSVAINEENVVVKLDGITYNCSNTSDKSLSLIVGKYCFIEHYSGSNLPEIVDMPEFSAFRLKDSSGGDMIDVFERQNGVPTVSPQGFKYISLTNYSKCPDGTTDAYPIW